MKKSIGFVAAVAAFGLINSANAADLPVKAPSPIAAPSPWTGLYVNGGFGYGAWVADQTVLIAPGGACITCVTQRQGGKGWLGTIGAGYDYQFTQRIVGGVFGDFQFSSLEGTIQDGQPFFASQIKETSSWAVGVRAGWLLNDRTLTYWNGGFTGARFSGATILNTLQGASVGLTTNSFNTQGWFLGSGVELALAPNWFFRNEYRYSYYNSKDASELTPAGVPFRTITFKPIVQTVTAQLVYKFNGGLPVPAYPPIPDGAINWTGPYVNVGFGYGLWSAKENSVNPATGACLICVTQTQGGKGWLGKIGIGYDWQFAPRWVVGAFGDVNWSSLSGTLQDHAFGFPQAISGDIKQTYAWAIGPRFGWLISPQTLAYVNGGYASAHFSGATMFNIVTVTPTGSSTQSFNTDGWFIGGGVETPFDLFGMLPKGFFMRGEYRYASYHNKTLSDTPGNYASINFKPVVQTITTSVIFKLN